MYEINFIQLQIEFFQTSNYAKIQSNIAETTNPAKISVEMI